MGVAQQQSGEVREIEEAGGIIAFPGMDVCDSDATSVPPDPVVAAGPQFIVHMVNSAIAVYDRDDLPESAEPIDVLPSNQFFGATSAIVDPRIVYDLNADQFVASAFGPQSVLRLAYTDSEVILDPDHPMGFPLTAWHTVSQGPVAPNGTPCDCWTDFGCSGGTACGSCVSSIPPDPPFDSKLIPDQPSLGYDFSAWYVVAPLVDSQAVDNPDAIGADNVFWIVEKADGGPPAFTDVVFGHEFEDAAGVALGCLDPDVGERGLFAARPAEAFGAPEADYFVGLSDVCSTCGPGEFDHIRLYAIANPTTPATRELRFFELPVDPFRYEGPESLPSPGGTARGYDARITKVVYREVNEGQGPEEFLYFTHAFNSPVEGTVWNGDMDDSDGDGLPCDPDEYLIDEVDRIGVRWYKVRLNGWPLSGTPEVADSGDVLISTTTSAPPCGSAAGRHLYLPSIDANIFGDIIIAMQKSSVTDRFAGVATGRFVDDDPGTTFPPRTFVVSETDSPPMTEGGGTRAGDYTDVALDPSDLDTFWFVVEWMRDGTNCVDADGDGLPDDVDGDGQPECECITDGEDYWTTRIVHAMLELIF